MKVAVWLAAALAMALPSAPASAQLKIGVIASSTGATAVIGIPQKNTAALLPKKIGDFSVEYFVFDDASDATQTVILVKRLLSEHKIDALIGPSGSPNAVSVVPLMAEAGTPMLAPVGATAIVLPMDDKKRWVFKTTQNDPLICEALIGHMVKTGVKTVGVISFNDPYGDNWYAVFSAQAQQAGIKVVANEKFLRTDASVTGQVAKLMATKPDAVLVAAAGGPTVLPHVTLVDAGYKGRIYQTHGAATPDFLRLGGAKVDGTVLAASLMLVLPEMSDSLPVQGSCARIHQRLREDVRQQACDVWRQCLRRGTPALADSPRSRQARQAGHAGISCRAPRRARVDTRARWNSGCLQHVARGPFRLRRTWPGADHRQGWKLAPAAGLTLARSRTPRPDPRVFPDLASAPEPARAVYRLAENALRADTAQEAEGFDRELRGVLRALLGGDGPALRWFWPARRRSAWRGISGARSTRRGATRCKTMDRHSK